MSTDTMANPVNGGSLHFIGVGIWVVW
jgi:hypothetical protein